VVKPVAASATAPVRALGRRYHQQPSPISPAPSPVPVPIRAGGENQPRDAASASSNTTPSRVTAPPVQASSRAPESWPSGRSSGWRGTAGGSGGGAAGPWALR